MASLDDMLERAERMETDPARSKLDDYAVVIWELRRKRKRVRTITTFLNEYGVRVHRATVARWLKKHPLPRNSVQVPNASAPSRGKLWPGSLISQPGNPGLFDAATEPEDHEKNH
jgi:hypothetical protein